MNILVTGGAGYIGSHTARALAQAGDQPVVIDDLSTGFTHNVKWGPLVHGSICESSLVRKTLEQYRIDAIVHFAGSALVAESAKYPLDYYQNNVGGSLSLLRAMLDAGVQDIVFSSSCATYGIPSVTPISEDQVQQPINAYGDSKLSVERVLDWMGRAGQIRWAALRYFNAAGADHEGEIGEEHEHETHLIPLAIGAALGQRERLKIFGNDYPTPDGTAVRDYIHVSDLASAHLCALKYLRGGGNSCAFNLGTGKGASVLEVVSMVEAVSGRTVPSTIAPRRMGDPPVLVANAEQARRSLQWEPRHSSLRSIIESAWNWHCAGQRQPDLKVSV